MFIDSHCHLNFKAFKKDLDQVLKTARDAGVSEIIIPGAKIDSSRKAIEIADKYTGTYAATGIHPHHAAEFGEYLNNNQKIAELKEKLKDLAVRKKTVAIGEIGLDHYQYSNYPPIAQDLRQLQLKLFGLQLDLAVELRKPVILHCRQAHEVMLGFLEKFLIDNRLSGVFHCFDGTPAQLEKVLSLGFYAGFDGNITYPDNFRLVETMSKTPLERLLLETDSPFLTPEPFRGSRNTPANLIHTAQFIAASLKMPVERLARLTSANAVQLFNLSMN
ncbi:MAG: sec-independent protein translocase protein, TatD DNase family protein [Candidatus Gottesmanbacteria bacterium GW2011_GWA2_43_14]|uniref:Sec-independent protein translocase protein, TatD DNase family protein n=1 Tax=Candidatus Gottesmanbacteria bacterium GW2011_GWA2_43_14 TaxID=1618443 RepID=A0A0G1DKN4_9BACT|nr:MAG: sec-independent protein translocase protein, TatD DNase family protein [Candidatus Gottesmanbacteria bacterium GW2011_GWA2_43_14]